MCWIETERQAEILELSSGGIVSGKVDIIDSKRRQIQSIVWNRVG